MLAFLYKGDVGAEIFSSIKAQILRPTGAYIPYATKEAKTATQRDGKRSSQKGCLGLYGQVNKRIRWMPRR